MSYLRCPEPFRSGLSLLVVLALCLLLAQCKSGSKGNGGGGPKTPPNTLVPIAFVTVKEGEPAAQVVVRRSNPAGGDISVEYATVDGSASKTSDYTAVTGTLTWSSDDNADKTIAITILDDQWFEGVEQFSVVFTNVQGAGIAPTSATVLILDDETTAAPTDPTQHLLYRFGSATSIGAAGEVNGDRIDDFVIGDGQAASKAGVVRVRSGLTGGQLFAIAGGAGEQLGAVVCGAGDLDQDGRDDFAATVPGTGLWIVRVFSGKSGQQLYEWKGTTQGVWTGMVVSPGGDLNGDGVPDLLIGLPRSGSASGRVLAYSGKDGTLLYTFTASGAGPSFGAAIAGVGDLDLDGFDDVLVGAPAEGVAAGGEGAVYLFSGQTGVQVQRLVGSSQDAAFGTALAPAGDVNKDGTGDFLVGAPGAVRSAGETTVFSGSTMRVLFTFRGEQANSANGASVGSAGDVNNDGYPDPVVGEPGDLQAGTGRGLVKVFSGKDGVPLYRYVGPSTGANFGQRVSAAGDVNGDGGADFLVVNSDSVQVLSGPAMMLTSDVSEISLRQGGRVAFFMAAAKLGRSRNYVLAGALGTSPGMTLGGIRVPLNADLWFNFSLTLFAFPGFRQMRGRFDVDGRRKATIQFPSTTSAAGVGLTLFHAFVVIDDRAKFHLASNAVPLRLAQ